MTETGDPGLDIFTMAGETISGWQPIEKTGDGPKSRKAIPYATTVERDAINHLRFHPGFAYAQRGDIKVSFAKKHGLRHRLPVPYVIPYAEIDGTKQCPSAQLGRRQRCRAQPPRSGVTP